MAKLLALSQIGICHTAGEFAHAPEERRALGHADGSARIEDVEDV